MDYSDTYCNPLPIPDYPRGTIQSGCPDCREMADPTVVYANGRWYLYATNGGAYESVDFVHWREGGGPAFPRLSAPTVVERGGKFYLIGSDSPLYEANAPLGPFRAIGRITLPDGSSPSFRDPMVFVDEDDRIYFYWGLGADGIYGTELDPENPTRALAPPRNLVRFDRSHEWERLGDWNQNAGASFIEGSWMLKHESRYYLTYSGPGTCYRTYAFGVYVGDSPLGDFEYQDYSPIGLNRHGLITGTGHGCFVEGPKGTLWAFYTIALCYAHKYERRIGFDPAGFDHKGRLFIARASETPQWAPGIVGRPELGDEAGLLPLTFAEPIVATSCAQGRDAIYATDESMLSWWQPAPDDLDPCITVDLRASYDVSAIRLIWRDVNLDYERGALPGPFGYRVEISNAADGEAPFLTVLDRSRNDVDYSVDYRTFPTTRARRVRLRITSKPSGIEPGVINFTAFGAYAEP